MKTVGAAILPLLVLVVGVEMSVNFFGALVPQVQRDFAVSAGTVATALAVYHGIRLVINVPAGRLIARSSPVRMVAAGGAVLAAGAAVVAAAPVFAVVLAGRVLMGIGSAVFFITTQFWISKASTPDTKAQLFSYNQLAALTGTALGPAVGGGIAGWFSWRYSLALAAIVGLITMLGAQRLADPTGGVRAPVAAPAGEPADPMRLSAVLGPGMIMMALFFFHGGLLSTLLPLLAARELGLGPAAIGGILMLGTLWRFGAALVGGRLARWVGTRRVVLASLASMAVSVLGFHLVSSPVGLVVVVSLMSWANVGGSLVTALVTDLVPEAHWGTALGVNRTLADVGAMIAPLLVGLAIDRSGFPAAITLVAAFLFIAAIAATILTSPRRLHAQIS
ncbi:MAG: MFS transporter [Armatimonadota bacterium]|nr:MFS transporter [Armatimonadota bacterium]